MATAIKALHDDFLSCNICTNLYKDPCTLGCGHTFCRECLVKFTKTQQDAIKAKCIRCPNCRQMTKVPHPRGAVEDWVKQIKPSFLMQGLLDRFASQSIEDIDLRRSQHRDCFGNMFTWTRFQNDLRATAVVRWKNSPDNSCFFCLQYDMKTLGTSHCLDCDIIFCDKCVKTHRALPGTSQHVIADLGGKIKVRRRKVMCKSHNCVVEFCCKDCQKAICQKCCILDHRKCDDVVTIESMVPEMKSFLGENDDILRKQYRQAQSSVDEKKTKIAEIQAIKEKLHSEIRKVSQKAINLIKQKEKHPEDELDDITGRQIEELKAQMKKGEIYMQMYQQQCEFVDQALTAESEMDMYEMYQLCQSRAITSAQIKSETENTSVQGKIIFEEKFDQEKMKIHFHLGTISLLKVEIDPNCTPTLVDTTDIRTERDTTSPDPVDVTVVDVGGTETLVITDYDNKSIKSFYGMGDQRRHSSIKLKSTPRSVTRLCHNQVVVSFSSYNEIVIVQVTPDLILLSNITTQKVYQSLTALNESTLVGGCFDPPSLDIIDMTGLVLRSITPDGLTIQWPSFLCTTNNGNILVSDSVANSVYCLTSEGDVIFHYSPSGDKAVTNLCGITTTSTGDILVADFNKNRLIYLTSTGQFVRDILTPQDGIFRPHGICLHKQKLYITEEDQTSVKVFCVTP